MKNFFNYLTRDFIDLSKKMKIFIFSIMFCGLLTTLEYSITRPASVGIFISTFSSKMIPYSWLMTVPLNFFVVYLYNRFLTRIGCLRIFFILCFLAAFINFITGLFHNSFPWLCFFQFMFKDVYILMMFKQIWSLTHSTVSQEKAKYFYGVMFAAGGIGSTLGSIIPSFFATKFGSESLLYFTLPLYFLLSCGYFLAFRNSALQGQKQDLFQESKPKILHAFNMIKSSKILTCILCIVIFMQMSSALADYQLSYYIEQNISKMDLRTQYWGRLMWLVNILSFTFQILGGVVLLRIIGLKRSHYMVPLILMGNALAFLLYPGFAMISYAFVSIKTVDYSVFGVIREILYAPLSVKEKFQAKAVIDVFAYRTTKAFASFFVLFLQFFAFSQVVYWINILAILILIFWIRTLFLTFQSDKIPLTFHQ